MENVKNAAKTNTLVILLTTILFDKTVGISSSTTAFLRESSPVAERDHFKPEPRINGGQYVAEPGFYLFIVNIEYFKSHLCGGGGRVRQVYSHIRSTLL